MTRYCTDARAIFSDSSRACFNSDRSEFDPVQFFTTWA
jgi:hypothetical protein